MIKFPFYFPTERYKTKQAPGVSSSLWESLNKYVWGFEPHDLVFKRLTPFLRLLQEVFTDKTRFIYIVFDYFCTNPLLNN